MLPTLMGRWQTRIFAAIAVGIPWTLFVTPFLPGLGGASYTDRLRYGTLWALLWLTIFGLFWDILYHGLMQLRWEKDWPTLFGLVTVFNEAVLLWNLIPGQTVDGFRINNPPASAFWWHLITTWIVIWLFLNGPMKMVFIRWRYRGGRVL